MESKSYMYLRYRKDFKFTSSLIRYLNTYKTLITLLSYQTFILALISEYNITNYLELLLNNFKENINLKALNDSKKNFDNQILQILIIKIVDMQIKTKRG